MEDLRGLFVTSYDRLTMTAVIPDMLDQLTGQDNNFEMVLSSALQPLKLFYTHNFATKTIGLVFINTELQGRGEDKTLIYEDASKRGWKAYDMLANPIMFGLDSVEHHENLTKEEIQGKFNDV